LNNILEIEFQIKYHMKVAFDFDKMNFIEFMWYYDRLKQEKENESKNPTGGRNLLDNIEDMRRMRMQ